MGCLCVCLLACFRYDFSTHIFVINSGQNPGRRRRMGGKEKSAEKEERIERKEGEWKR